MLESLRVNNFVLIDDVELALGPGLTVLTGETGAGKSLVVGALALALGERAAGDLVRPGARQGCVEATFAYPPRSALGRAIDRLLEEAGIEPEEGLLIVRRLLSADGRSRCTVNGSATVLKVVAALGDLLVDLHGQHEHQSLLRPAVYLDLLDAYGELEDVAGRVAAGYAERQALRERLDALVRSEEERLRELDLVRFQVRELDAAELDDPEEETRLETERERLRHSELLHERSAQAYRALAEGEDSASDRLSTVADLIAEMARVDPSLAEPAEQIETARTLVDEVARSLERYDESMEHEPGRLETIEERLHLFRTLQRKYGATPADVIAFHERARRRLDELENADTHRAELERELASVEERLARDAQTLHDGRAAAGVRLARQVQRVLATLALADAHCAVEVRTEPDPAGLPMPGGQRLRVGPYGVDQAEILLSTNPGAAPAPLRQVASGGELSRVMLAIKSALAASSRVPTLIFDEIDIGVGGRTADAVGEALQRLSERYQLVCITHLPQIAAKAAHHFVVEKGKRGKQAQTTVRKLDARERADELARMLGGAEGSREALRHAQALLRENA